MPDPTIEAWLNQLGLSQYARAFTDNHIDLDILPALDDQALQVIGVASVGHRIRLLRAIHAHQALRQAADSGDTGASQAATALNRPESERRHLTVLFCDMVAYTELADGVDPEVLQQLIRRYEEVCSTCITRYGGYVFQRLGDGIVAFFGYPVAHEGEAERAIYAALDIISKVAETDMPVTRRIHVRIGIASGVVVISPSREGAIGDTMVLAARLQGIAGTDGIVVSAAVRKLARDVFDFEDLGPLRLKGFSMPAPAFRVLGVGSATSRFEAATRKGPARLVNREQEMSLLLARWIQAQDGDGQVVLISGEPGIGKSRLLLSVRTRIEATGGQVVLFQASPYHDSSTYHPLIDSLERTLCFERDDTIDQRLDKIEALVTLAAGLTGEDARFIASLLDVAHEGRYGVLDITPQKHKDEIQRVLVELLVVHCRRQPTLLIYEDVHWSDPSTLEVIERLIERANALPLLMVLSYRPEFNPGWDKWEHLSALTLPRLSQEHGREVVRNLVGGKVFPSELLDRILEKTDGVPLYLEEFTQSVIESGGLRAEANRFEYASGAQNVIVPATLRDSLMARLDRSPALREVAKIGAAIGREFSYDLIAAVAPSSKSELDGALQLLTDSGLAFQRHTGQEAIYVFKHALIQDLAYDSLLKARRQELHARIARVIQDRLPGGRESEPELLARHLSAAGESVAAIGYWLKAGKLALDRMALREAISHLEQGMKSLVTMVRTGERDGRELDLRIALGTAWAALRGFASAEAWTNFQRALQLAKALHRNAELLPIYFGLASNLVLQGRLVEGLEVVKETLANGLANDDSDLRIIGYRTACTTYFWLGEFAVSRQHGEHTLELYDPERHRHLAQVTNVDPRTIVESYLSLGAWIMGYPDQALAYGAAREAHARSRGHAFDIGYALTFGASVFELTGDYQALLVRVEEAELLGKAQSLPFIADILVPILRGIARIRTDRLDEGIELLETGLNRWTQGGGGMWVPYLRAVLADAWARCGDSAKAMAIIEQSLAQISRPGWEERSHLAEVHRLKGEILLRQGQPNAAEDQFTIARDVAFGQAAKGWELRAAISLARLWASQGRGPEARQLLTPVYQWFQEGHGQRDLHEAEALLDSLT